MKRTSEREKCFQNALMGVKQPYDYARARMLWCVWHVLGTQRSGVAEATAAQQEQPEADLPVSAAAAASQHSSVQHTKLVQCQCTSDVKRQGSNCTLFTWINSSCFCFCLLSDSPSQWWRDLSHSSRRQGVEVGHVWSGVMPRHSLIKQQRNKNVRSTGCRYVGKNTVG